MPKETGNVDDKESSYTDPRREKGRPFSTRFGDSENEVPCLYVVVSDGSVDRCRQVSL